MNAVISGRAGVAMLLEGDQCYSLHGESPETFIPRRPEEFSFLFGTSDDVEYLYDVDRKTIRKRLEDAIDFTDALDYLLYLLDPTLSDKTRSKTARYVNELLEYPEVVEQVEQILFARPLPESADLMGALQWAHSVRAVQVTRFFEILAQRQSAIERVRDGWSAAAESTFASAEDRRIAEAECLRLGLFRRFVRMIAGEEQWSQVFFAAINAPSLNSRFDRDRVLSLIQKWCVRLLPKSSIEIGVAPAKAEAKAKKAKYTAKIKAKAKVKVKPKRSKAKLVVRKRLMWGVFSSSTKEEGLFPYADLAGAEARRDELAAKHKRTYFIQPIKKAVKEATEESIADESVGEAAS